MDLEGENQLRVENIKIVFEAMAKILKSPKTSPDQKIAAAKVVDSLSDTIVKTYILTEELGETDKTSNKLLNQLDKLTDEKE